MMQDVLRTIGCRVHCRKAIGKTSAAAVTEIFSELESASILGGNSSQTEANRFSYWAAEPAEIFEFAAGDDDPFDKLQSVLDKYKLTGSIPEDLPKGIFVGGWIGYFGYELGGYIEKLPGRAVDDLEMPLIRLCFYDAVICYDRAEDNWWLIALAEEKLGRLEELFTESQSVSIAVLPAGDLDGVDISRVRCNITKEYYLDALARIKQYIYDGDTYQINFSQRFEAAFAADGVELYHWQNEYNPSPYSAFIDADNFSIVSASPEMFLTVEDRVISTKPIKGTRRRFEDDKKREFNEKNYAELLACEKEKAELNMIIDLERNDLGRICEYGTIKVTQPRTIESYPTVFHAVATVEGRLRGEISFCDILRGTFPGGSITGAPKVRSMEIIDELEPTQRGIYTGAIGWIGVEGNACLNIAIRTIIIKDGKAYAQTGGGIVADSYSVSEWQETITKARALLAGIAAVSGTEK